MNEWKEKYGISIKLGDPVKFLGEGGYPYQLENALVHLKKDEVYTLSNIFVDTWGVYYYLEEVPNKSFPEDMFERL